MFSLVQTRKGDAKPEMFIVPTKWLISDDKQLIVQYPKKNFNTLSRDPESEPEPNWTKQPCKLLGKKDSFDEADGMMSDFANITDSSDAVQMTRGTRMTPAKKMKSFRSKSYALESNVSESQQSQREVNQQIQVNQSVNDSNQQSVLPAMSDFDPDIFFSENNLMETNESSEPSHNQPVLIYTVNDQSQITAAPTNEIIAAPTNQITTAPTNNESNVIYDTLYENIETLPVQMEGVNSFDFVKKIDILTLKVDQMNEKMEKFDVLSAKVDKLVEFMMNLEKLISDSKAGRPQDEQMEEDFSEFDGMKPAESAKELQSLEILLANTDYADKLFRFIKKNKSLDGKGNGKTIARYAMRLLVKPQACFEYTWKGQQRKGQVNPNQCFKTTFPKFIDFVNRIACAGDIEFAMDKTHSVIETFLRNKHAEASKNLQENVQPIQNAHLLQNAQRIRNAQPLQNAQSIPNAQPIQIDP